MKNNLTKIAKAFLLLSFFCFSSQIYATKKAKIAIVKTIYYKNLLNKHRGSLKIDDNKTIADLAMTIKMKEKFPQNSKIDMFADKKLFKVSKPLDPNKKIKDCIIKKKTKKGKKRKPDFYYAIRPNSVIPATGSEYLH